MRASMSAIGSVMVIGSPARFRDAGNLPVVCHIPEAQPAKPEALVNGTRPPTAHAAAVGAHFELRPRPCLVLQRLLSHLAPTSHLARQRESRVPGAGSGPPRRSWPWSRS